MYTVNDFFAGLKIVTRISAEDSGNLYILKRVIKGLGETEPKVIVVGEITKDEIDSILKDINENYTYHDVFLYNSNQFEVAVTPIDRTSVMLSRYENGNLDINEHGYSFEFSKASTRYFVSLFCNITEKNSDALLSNFSRLITRDPMFSLESLVELFRLNTIRISSSNKNSLTGYKRISNSYLFNIAYNTGMVFSICDFSQRRYSNYRRNLRKGQLFPYRIYNSELTAYYYQALASDIPFTQYLAYYHVAETFFQTLSEQSVIDEIKDYITRPSFSPNKKEELKQLYEKLKKKTREQRDDGVWNEKTALLICLKHFIPDLKLLERAVDKADSNALSYYKSNLVEFADESKLIDFDNSAETTYSSIRDRVYSVRNAIVHSKMGDKARYEPFRHDSILVLEIPLIKCIAEEIIINSAIYTDVKPEN